MNFRKKHATVESLLHYCLHCIHAFINYFTARQKDTCIYKIYASLENIIPYIALQDYDFLDT